MGVVFGLKVRVGKKDLFHHQHRLQDESLPFLTREMNFQNVYDISHTLQYLWQETFKPAN